MQRFDYDESIRYQSRLKRNKKLIFIGGIAVLTSLIIIAIILIVLFAGSKKLEDQTSSTPNTKTSLGIEHLSLTTDILTTLNFSNQEDIISKTTENFESSLSDSNFLSTDESSSLLETLGSSHYQIFDDQNNTTEVITVNTEDNISATIVSESDLIEEKDQETTITPNHT